MSNPTNSAVPTPAGDTPPFGGIHPLVLGLSLQGIHRQLASARLFLESGSVQTAVAEIAVAQARLADLQREAFQESDRIEQDAAEAPRQLPVRVGDVAVMAEIRKGSGADLSAHGTAFAHTPTDSMPPMKPIAHLRGYEAQESTRLESIKSARLGRRRWNPARYLSADGFWAAFQVVVLGGTAAVVLLVSLNSAGVL